MPDTSDNSLGPKLIFIHNAIRAAKFKGIWLVECSKSVDCLLIRCEFKRLKHWFDAKG